MPPVVFFGTAVVLVVLGLVTAGVMVVLRGDVRSDDGAHAGPTRAAMGIPAAQGIVPSSYSDSPSAEVFGPIDERSTDSGPLTVEEVFPASAESLPDPEGKGKLTLRDRRLDVDCAEAVWGAGVGKALREGGCTQALRGVYSGDRYAMIVAIFNVARVEDANRVVGELGQDGAGGFVKPLDGGFGQGFSVARGLAMGHYVVVGWVRRLDGGGDAQDEALLSLLVEAGGDKAILGRAARSR